MKKYYESMFVRFFSWPKTILFGNHFYFKNPESKTDPNYYYLEKKPRSNSLGLKLIAGFLYPLFNPIAFSLRKIGSLFNAYEYIQNGVREQNGIGKGYKTSIKNQIRSEGSVKELLTRFEEKEAELGKRWTNLRLNKLTSVKEWKNEAMIKEFDEIFSEAALNFPLLLIAMRQTIEEEKTPKDKLFSTRLMNAMHEALEDEEHIDKKSIEIAKRLVAQPQDGFDPSFAGGFMYSTLINMYHAARDRSFWIKKGNEWLVSGPEKSTKSHKNVSEFYTQGTPEYKWRQAYNTNMKLFYAQFPNKNLRKAFNAPGVDSRFDIWTRIDTSKEEASFEPHPGTTRPTC